MKNIKIKYLTFIVYTLLKVIDILIEYNNLRIKHTECITTLNNRILLKTRKIYNEINNLNKDN